MGLTGVISSPYGAVEAFVYDLFLAPIAQEMLDRSGARPWEGLPPAARLLDVGCGGGHLARHIATCRPDLKLTGVDLSEGQVARARKRLAKLGAEARFVQGSALALPFEERSFDAVVSVGSIKHWPDRRLGLGECARVLAPGGALMVLEFDRDSDDATLERLVARWHPPWFLRPRIASRLRRKVIGQSLSVAEARALASELPLAEIEVRPVAGTPMLLLEAKRTASGV
jgi:ubiquinone/menaquinone biosynthesis C-methylase UbiE